LTYAYISLSANLPSNKTMTDSEFSELCIDIGRVLGCDDINELADTGEIILDDVRIGLFYTEEEGDVISCFVDVGLIEEAFRPTIFENILVLNLEINGLNGETLGFDRNSGHLVLRATMMPASGCTADALAVCLSDYAQFIQRLRAEVLSNNDLHSDVFLSELV